jgi:hypothetical protein
MVVDAPDLAGQLVACPQCAGQFTMPGEAPIVSRPRAARRAAKAQEPAWAYLAAVALLALPFVGCIALCSGAGSHRDKAETNSASLTAGDMGVMERCMVGVDPESANRISRLANAKDSIGLAQMERQGKLFIVEDGTRVRVIGSSGFASLEVRIESGAHFGQSGVVPYEFVKPQ